MMATNRSTEKTTTTATAIRPGQTARASTGKEMRGPTVRASTARTANDPTDPTMATATEAHAPTAPTTTTKAENAPTDPTTATARMANAPTVPTTTERAENGRAPHVRMVTIKEATTERTDKDSGKAAITVPRVRTSAVVRTTVSRDSARTRTAGRVRPTTTRTPNTARRNR